MCFIIGIYKYIFIDNKCKIYVYGEFSINGDQVFKFKKTAFKHCKNCN